MMTEADRLARALEAVAGDAERILPLSHTRPHVFCEQKDAVARRLRKLAAELRNTFGGTTAPAPAIIDRKAFWPGRRPNGVRVEIRRKAHAA